MEATLDPLTTTSAAAIPALGESAITLGGVFASGEAQALIAAALAQAGATLDEVVRVNYIVPQAADFEACWPVLRQYLGRARPAATMVSAGLIDPRMKIEIEVTALKGCGAHNG